MQWYIVVGIFLQVFLKLRTENSVCFSSLTLAMVVIIALVLVTNMDLTVGQLQKTKYFTRFQGEREKKKLLTALSLVISPDTVIPLCKHKNRQRLQRSCTAGWLPVEAWIVRWLLWNFLIFWAESCMMIFNFTWKALVPESSGR